jgi:hypothetical protein
VIRTAAAITTHNVRRQPRRGNSIPPSVRSSITPATSSIGSTCAAVERRSEAKDVDVHPNTVRHRLERFKEITGRSLRETETLVELWWALQRRRLG